MLKCVWRAAVPALAVASSLVPSSAARAYPLPSGLEGGCTISGCQGAHYWDPEAGGNGHYYAFVAASAASFASSASAASGSSIGATSIGYLATIDSSAENDYIVSQVLPTGFSHKNQVWLGGVQSPGAKSPASDWHWITPEVWDYTNWAPGEPNDENPQHTGNEDHLTMWVHFYVAQTGGFAIDMRGMWNDENAVSETNAPIVGYIVEWEKAPEPAAALLALLGLGALAARRARR